MAYAPHRKPFLYVVTRDRWKALPPLSTEPLAHPAQTLLIIYTGHEPCLCKKECKEVMRKIQKEALDAGHPDILYNFCIGGEARVYEGRGWNVKVDRPDQLGWRKGAIVLGYIGKEFVDDDMTEMLIRRGYKFANYAILKRYLINPPKVYDESNILTL